MIQQYLEHAIVFHSANGYDELIPGVPASGVEVHEGWTRPWSYDAETLRQRAVEVEELAGSDAAGNAEMLERLLDGEEGARREAVLLNVAVALVVEGRAADVVEGYDRARTAIDSGSAGSRLAALKAQTKPAEPR